MQQIFIPAQGQSCSFELHINALVKQVKEYCFVHMGMCSQEIGLREEKEQSAC